jgi:hypothetical protein
LFALSRVWPERVEPLVLEPARVEAVAAEWQATNGAPPDARETAALVEAAIDEELLLREAYARGLDRDDPVVRARLARNARFLGEGEPGAGDAELAQAVRSLGLERGDLVVRRRLVERMRAALEAEATPPTEAEIRARLARYPAVRAPDRVRLAHSFEARREDGSQPGALRELIWIARTVQRVGEPTLPGVELEPRSERELAAEFGAEFARAVFALPVGRWSDPLESAYGEHLVFVKERIRGAPQTWAVLRPRVEAELREERARAALRAGLARLRARQPIRVAERAP